MRGRVSFFTIVAIIFATIAIVFEFYFGLLSGVGFIIQVILLAIFATFLRDVFSKKSDIPFFVRVRKLSLGICSFFGFFIAIPLLWITYYIYFPGKISDIVLTNGKQQVVFASMSHIASDDFYHQKKQLFTKLADEGYTFLVEGVGSGSKDNHQKFNNALGIEFTQELYPSLALLAGLSVQKSSYLFADIPQELLVNRDMSLDEIVGYFSSGGIVESSTGITTNVSKELDLIGNLSQQERTFIRYIFRSFLNWSIANMADIETLSNEGKKELFDIILHKRNEKIGEYIRENPEKNIVIVYGALHFEGVLELLLKQDKNWRIQSFTSFTPYSD